MRYVTSMNMEFWFIATALSAAVFWYFGFARAGYKRKREEQDAKQDEKNAKRRRADAIEGAVEDAREKAEMLAIRGAIFEITMTTDIRGYHVKELGWVSCDCEKRSEAENALRIRGARKYQDANVLTKLSFNLNEERYQAGTNSHGDPYYKNRTFKTWEALAGIATPNDQMDKSPNRWDMNSAVLDGSNIAHWDDDIEASLEPVAAVIDVLRNEKIETIVVFDANIGFKISDRHLAMDELKEMIGRDVEIEVVKSGTIADRRIIEIAENKNCIIVSNDLFRDSVRARHLPKQRGFFVFGQAGLIPPRA